MQRIYPCKIQYITILRKEYSYYFDVILEERKEVYIREIEREEKD